MYYVYILVNKKNNQTYIGSTSNLRRRLKEHNNGKEISTKKYMPWTLEYYEAYKTEGLARSREKRLKQHGNAKRELKKRINLNINKSDPVDLSGTIFKKFQSGAGSPSTNSGAGFTLIDLAVSAGILVVILSFVLANFRGVNQNNLKLFTQSIANDIRYTQTMGLAGKMLDDGTYPDGGYGIKMSKCVAEACFYEIFFDLDSNVNLTGENEKIRKEIFLGKNYIDKIYSSTVPIPSAPVPSEPHFTSPDWEVVASDFFVATFVLDQVFIRVEESGDPDESIQHIGVILKNEKSTDYDAYFSISKQTGLISSGILYD